MTPYEGAHVVNSTDAVLKCALCVIPRVSFTWVKNEGVIPLGRTNATDCSLVIRKTKMEDTGNYSCIGRDQSGTLLRQDIPLTVRGQYL